MVTATLWKSRILVDSTIELADPDYMIGALYLNHYATWRENGIVNIARHLLQTTSSQLIWHEAVSESEALVDDRVAAVAAEIGKLGVTMIHPRVRLVHQATQIA